MKPIKSVPKIKDTMQISLIPIKKTNKKPTEKNDDKAAS